MNNTTVPTTLTGDWVPPQNGDDLCDCDQRCPSCGKVKRSYPRVVWYPVMPQPPLYWWQRGGSPTC